MEESFALKYFKDLVRERAGLTFDNTREEILRQKVGEVMGQKGYRSRVELFRLIKDDNTEFLDFVNHLTINETYFFREPKYLQLLTNHLVPELLTRRGNGAKLKIISAGCSTGEEPYSIAIALLEKYGANTGGLFTITGIDIDSVALVKANEGVYGKLSFRNNEGLLQANYFDQGKDNRLKIKPFVKQQVCFQRVNLLDCILPEELHGADIIFYRNVSIYFDSATQQKILSGLASLLHDGGYVIFASSETFSHKDNRQLTLVEQQGLFCYQKKESPHQNNEVSTPIKSRPVSRLMSQQPAKEKESAGKGLAKYLKKKSTESPKKENLLQNNGDNLRPEEMLAQAVDFYRKKENYQALTLVAELKKCERYAGKAYLLEGCILMNSKKNVDAEVAFTQALHRDELDLDAHMMLGLIAKNSGKTGQAKESFQKAIYVNDSCWMAHYLLAEIHHEQGEKSKAVRYYDTVLKILGNGDMESAGMTFFPISFRRQDLMHLCRKKLALYKA